MRAVNFVEHVKLMPDANLLDPRERLLMEQRLLVLWVCLQPFSSARDLLAHEVLAQPRTYDLLARLRRDGYLVTRYLQRFNLNAGDVNANGAHLSLVEAAVIREAAEGIVPRGSGPGPICS